MDSFNPIEVIKDWKAADPELILNKIRERGWGSRARWIFTKNISPLDLYIYLKSRFGYPNGFQMLLRNPSSDNLIHWHWTLQYEKYAMDFMGYNLRAEVLIEGLDSFSDEAGFAFEDGIKRDFENYGQDMAFVRRGLEKWNLFVNPYYRLRTAITNYSKELRALSIENLKLPEQPRTSEEAQHFSTEFEACRDKYSRALGYCISIRMLVPVMAEAFINMIIFLMAKSHIKKDQRLYNNEIRQEIDIRVKKLNIICDGFKNPIPTDSGAFKRFHSLMNGRNDLLHGNIDPIKLKYDIVYFDKNIPLPISYKNFAELFLVNSLIHIEPETAFHDIDIVDDFIKLILDQVSDKASFDIQTFMNTSNPGWREDTMRVGVLLPAHMVDAIPREKRADI